ncbi:HAMP domain-containing histidine kinase [Hwanghaeella grinnelliae]|uniref:histidine kinase n=1 Tax=Hwanghaeella grinnelliae TaxID=2500179 RepID=A0A437QUP6_9PROT|nr:HAMP domain-containing sensor histidine kinase [Hwanghaeella grinnelliae]RVU38223.1 HAMP domain-containing histidine kinase [Hwanghaeella grinnelliae]
MTEKVKYGLNSLRFRLVAGALVIALVAVFTGLLAAYGAAETVNRISQSVAAQHRMEILSSLSARISDYAVVGVEADGANVPVEVRNARLQSQAELVDEAFERMEKALAGAVEESRSMGETEQMRRATRSLVLARMKAQYRALRRSLEEADSGKHLRAHLDSFATQFSPLLNEAIADERRDRDAASRSVEELHDLMIYLAVGAGVIAIALVILFYRLLIRPLIYHLNRVAVAASDIGSGDLDIDLPVTRRDELGALFGVINSMAERLRQRRSAVDSDRAQLNETIATRTAELSEANGRLSLIDSERRRFFADVGHELRTPLTVILAESELALKEGVNPAEAVDALSVIRSRAVRLNRRIDDLLRVARSETGQVELDSRPFDVATAAEEAVADMAPLAKRHDLKIYTAFEAAPTIGDADWCRQVICGLIENAVKHSPKGAVIEVSTQVTDGQVELVILDEGEGLVEGDVERVFGRFARGAREVMGSGFGVGLALARWVVDQQSGSIEINSPAPRPPKGGTLGGRGAQVVVRLPVQSGAQVGAQTRKVSNG